jgi:hypothetical protein
MYYVAGRKTLWAVGSMLHALARAASFLFLLFDCLGGVLVSF